MRRIVLLIFAFLVLLPGISSADNASDIQQDTEFSTVIGPKDAPPATAGNDATTSDTASGANDPAKPLDSAFISCSPTTMTAGQSYLLKVTVKNTGSETWSTRGMYDRIVFRGDETFAITLPQGTTVEPGQECTFFLPMTAPAAGRYSIEFWMEHNADVFGEVKAVEFAVE